MDNHDKKKSSKIVILRDYHNKKLLHLNQLNRVIIGYNELFGFESQSVLCQIHEANLYPDLPRIVLFL